MKAQGQTNGGGVKATRGPPAHVYHTERQPRRERGWAWLTPGAMTATPARTARPRLGERGAVTVSVEGRSRALALHSVELVAMTCGGTAGWRRRAPPGCVRPSRSRRAASGSLALPAAVRHVVQVRGISTRKCGFGVGQVSHFILRSICMNLTPVPASPETVSRRSQLADAARRCHCNPNRGRLALRTCMDCTRTPLTASVGHVWLGAADVDGYLIAPLSLLARPTNNARLGVSRTQPGAHLHPRARRGGFYQVIPKHEWEVDCAHPSTPNSRVVRLAAT